MLKSSPPRSSPYRGVSWVARAGRKSWRAKITHRGRVLDLGYFCSPEAAARAYDRKAKSLLGDRARLNFRPGDDGSGRRAAWIAGAVEALEATLAARNSPN